MCPEQNEEAAWLVQALRGFCEPIVCVDPEGRVRFANASARAMLWPGGDELQGITDGMLLHIGGAQYGALSTLRQALAQGELLSIPARSGLLLPGREAVPVEGHIMPVRDARGAIQGAVMHLHDLRGRREAEIDLRDSETRFRQLSEASFEGVMIHDQGRIVDCNSALARLTGYSHEDLLGMDALLLVTPESRAVVRENISSGGERHYEVTGLRKDGSTYPVEISGRPIPYQGRMLRVVVVRDITQLKRREEQRLSAAESLRVTLIREVHHRIKNTLQGVANLMYQHALRHPEIAGYLEDAVAQIRSVALALGLESLDRTEGVRLCELVSALKQSNESLTHNRIELNIPAHAACPIHLDKEESVALALVINELIMNAIKHSSGDERAAQIEVSSAPEGNRAVVRVCNPCDAGGGFDYAASKGLGTGLSLVRSLLPLTGASLTYTWSGPRLCAELSLREPVIRRAA